MIPVSTQKIHIISIVKDDNSGLKRTLNSIAAQVFSNALVSILIIDGSTSETTTEITKLFRLLDISLIRKEPQGIYNAMNEGIEELASICPSDECLIIFLNAGDFFIDASAIQKIVDACQGRSFVVSNAVMFDPLRDTSLIYPEIIFGTGKEFMHPVVFWLPHQGIAARYSLYKQVGLFSENFMIAGDYDWIYRAVKQFGTPFIVHERLVAQVIDGISNKRSFSGYRERLRLAKSIGLQEIKLPGNLVLKMRLKESLPHKILTIFRRCSQKLNFENRRIKLEPHEVNCECPVCLFSQYSL